MNSLAISSTDIDRGVVDGVVAVYKNKSETPLECLKRLQNRYSALGKVPLSYAGRLDPLAEGVLLVLAGNYNQRREEFLGLDKVYEIEVLFGVSTDTGDVMGHITTEVLGSIETSTNDKNATFGTESIDITILKLERVAELLVGVHDFPYPIYSSKTVDGKPLHAWAKEGNLSKIEIPKTHTEIYEAKFVDLTEKSAGDIFTEVELSIKGVVGDFRQESTIFGWRKFKDENPNKRLHIATFKISAASGAYMRTLAEYIGKQFNCRALAYSIKRLQVGEFRIEDCIEL